MIPVFAAKLGHTPRSTNVGAQKFHDLRLETYSMALAGFSIQDKSGGIWFFKKKFSLADTSMKLVLEIIFLAFNNVNIQFDAQSFTWRLYTAAKALLTARQVEMIDKDKFAMAALNENIKTYVIYVATLKAA